MDPQEFQSKSWGLSSPLLANQNLSHFLRSCQNTALWLGAETNALDLTVFEDDLYFEKKNLAHTGAEGFAITVKKLELISHQFHLRSTNIVLEFYCKIAERSCDFAKVLVIINKMTSDICRKCATVLQSIWCFSPFNQQQSTLDIKILPSIKELLRMKCLFIKFILVLYLDTKSRGAVITEMNYLTENRPKSCIKCFQLQVLFPLLSPQCCSKI